MSKGKNFFRLIVALAVCQLAGAIGAAFTSPAIPTWYAWLQKPSFSPPDWLFAPVWGTLYVLIGVAVWLVWKKGTNINAVRWALWLFLLQLSLNSLWSIIFFGFRNVGGALVEIGIMWLAIAATIVAFFRVSRPAAYLLVPYFLWVTFAAILNHAIWMLN